MSASTTLEPRGLRIDNPNKRIERIYFEPEDHSLFNQANNNERIKIELESSIIATTITEDKIQQIENIYLLKDPLIRERNAILDNVFKYYNPFYRKKLKNIDTKLNELDFKLYKLESETKEIELSLDKAIKEAQKKFKDIL